MIETNDRTKTFLGSPLYKAPEVSPEGEGYTNKIDVWAIGIMAYEMLVGKNPFIENTNQGLSKLLKT